MRRFVFKLEGVLEQRRQVEAQRQRELAEVQRQMMTLSKQIDQAASAANVVAVPLRGRIDPRVLAAQVRFTQVMRQKLASLREQLQTAKQDLSAAHASLVEASKQRKVLEKLHEKQQERWLEEQQKLEAAAHDEIAQQMTHGDRELRQSFPAAGP